MIYNVVFVSPLIVIILMVAGGMQVEKISAWKNLNKKWMRLTIGITLIVLSWLLILISSGAINLG